MGRGKTVINNIPELERYYAGSYDVLFKYTGYDSYRASQITYDYCFYTKQYDLRLIGTLKSP